MKTAAIAVLVSAIPLAAGGSAEAQSQTDMNISAEASRKAANQDMTVAWHRVMASMKALDAQNTSRGGGFGFAATELDAQRKWLALRDRQCSIERAVFKGGSMASTIGAQCETRMTEERTADFRSLFTLTK